jgi:hypothetical protein
MKDRELCVFCSNVRGLVKNWCSASNFDWDKYDLIGFNEIWGVKEFENLKVNNFEVLTCRQRTERRGGGSIIFGKSALNVKVLNTPFVEGIIESTGVKVNGIIFLNIYRPPSGDKTEFLEILSQYLDTVRGSKLLLGGDYNINSLSGYTVLNSICSLYNLEVKINDITRIESGTCIDNFLSNVVGKFEVNEVCIADHQAITAKVPCENNTVKKLDLFTYREMKESNWQCFKQGIHSINIRGEDINIKWSNLLDDIKSVVEHSFPEKTRRTKYIFTMSQGLLKSKDRKNKLLSQYKRGLIVKDVYVNYNRVYRKLVWIEQNKKFEEKMLNAGGSGKKKWKALKEVLYLDKDIPSITEICVEGAFKTDKLEIAKAFKNHFETCAAKLAEGLPPGEDTSVVMPQGQEWKLEQTCEQNVIKIIKSLKNKNSSGYDCLSNRMLKREPHAFARLIVDLINESMEGGIFPECLKTAKVIPVYKKGDRTNLNNYRPISLLPVLSKVFEKVVNSQLNGVIELNFIDENQFGFRSGHSTEDAVVKFVNRIEKDLANKLHVVTVYVDVSKAFDSCDHEILLSKIRRTGLDQMGVTFFKNYLLNRSQMVAVNGVEGGSFAINIGVGQGTVLGPTLFKIYIMDMHLCTKLFCVKFADDSSFEGSGKSREEVETLVNTELIKINDWFRKNRLTLHPDKSRVIIHSRDKLINIKLNNQAIQRCGYGLQEESVKLLGILIDENLDWNEHIKSIEKKISKGNYLLWRHRKKLMPSSKKVIYESFVRCHILYGIIAWGGSKKIKLLEKTLKKIWKKMGPRIMHTNQRLRSNEILLLTDEIKLQESKWLYKWERGLLPISLKPIIEEKFDRLRGRRFKINRNTKLNGIEARLTKLANKDISKITAFTSLEKLSQNIKREALNGYDVPCRLRNCFICRNSAN